MSISSLSLRSRLIAGIFFVAAVLTIVSAVVTISTRDRLIDQVDQRLTSFAPGPRVGGFDRLPPLDATEPTESTFPGPPTQSSLGERVSDVYQGIIDSDGTLITIFSPNLAGIDYTAPSIDATDLPDQSPAVLTVESTDGAATYRVRIQPLDDLMVVTGVPIDDVQSTISRLVLVEVLGSLAILAALGLVGWWVVHLGIRPVQEMTQTASRIAGGDLSVRIPEIAPQTESGQLAVALNQMLTRIETALDERAASEARLRRFVSDASHELRTPVTSIRGYAEMYRIGALTEPVALDDAMRRTELEAARIGRLVDDMLTLARSDEERPLADEPVDLSGLVHDAATDARVAAPHRDITVDITATDTWILGDEDRLRQVMANVVTNALVHTDPSVPITLRLQQDDPDLRIEVIDTGQGMPAEIAARVTERFFRADPSRSRDRGGSGLGMAIVDAVMAAHQGSVQVDSRPGQGTTVTLAFPLGSSRPDASDQDRTPSH